MLKNQGTFHRHPPAQFDGQFVWDYLKGAFGKKIMPMDFDGVVERNGRFLVFETKDIGVPIPTGQIHALEAALATGFFTVFLIQGKMFPEELIIWALDANGYQRERVIHPATQTLVWQQAHNWFQWASEQPKSHGILDRLTHLEQKTRELEKLVKELVRQRDRHHYRRNNNGKDTHD